MQRLWSADELGEHWTLGPEERKLLAELTGACRLDRILRSARATHDDTALQRVADRLDAGLRARLGALLADDGEGTSFARVAADPGRVGLESLLAEIAKLNLLRGLALPPGL